MLTSPTRMTAGFTQEPNYRPLGRIGVPNPLFYAQFGDDFMSYNSANYTVTATGNGTAAQAAAVGGALLLTTNSSTPVATDIVALQAKAACLGFAPPYKGAFLARIRLSDVTNVGFILGNIQTTTTPFTVTDGIYFSKASGGTAITLNHAVGGSITSVTIPTTAYTLANNMDLDLGWALTHGGDVEAFVGVSLVGNVLDQDRQALGPVARLPVGVAMTTAVLNPTIAIKSGTTASKTAQCDFFFTASER